MIALVLQLNTHVGMIMEDASPLALDATPEGVEARVQEIGAASRRIAALIGAAQSLLTE